ncbi:MAG TPA: hypothetical protein VK938_06805 [Methylophilaceae bacterium]|jgi:hypothetical protein|nr:hypothetical protein [Methylophilaceae bacterium]
MSANNPCNKTVLAGESGCRVVYCHDCHVAELEVGSVSLRLKDDAFRNLSSLMAAAVVNLDKAFLNDGGLYGQDGRHVH